MLPHTLAHLPSAQAPAPRNLTNELMQTYKGYANTALPYYNLESQFDPAYARLNLDMQRQNLLGFDVPGQPALPGGGTPPLQLTNGSGGNGFASLIPITNKAGAVVGFRDGSGNVVSGHDTRRNGGVVTDDKGGVITGNNDAFAGIPNITQTPGHHPGTIELSSLQRGADIADVEKYGPAATAAYLKANPYLKSSLNLLTGRMQDSPILATLNRQANDALARGGQLSPEEEAANAETTRSMYAARGLAVSNPAVASEVLNRDAAMRARLAAAQQFATGVQGLNQNQNDFIGRGTQISGSVLADPWQAILNRSSGAAASAQPIGTGARLFDPTNPYAADIYNTNYNAQAAANNSNANNQAALTAAGISAAGAIIGGSLAFSDKRLKTDIRGTGRKTRGGTPIKSWRYKHDPKRRRHEGVIAQDAERHEPHAVRTEPMSGLKAVDYSVLDGDFDLISGTFKKAA